MRKTLLVLASSAMLMGSSLAYAAGEDVGDAMDTIASNYKTALKTDNPQEFKKALEGMKAGAQEAQKGTPPKLEKEPADGAKMTDFRHGLDILIGQINDAEKLADAGQFEQAKAAAEKFKDTRNAYHKKYK
ncbi:cytochrome b562 [Hafnia alvei]